MRITDLTQTLEPGLRGFNSEKALTIADNGWNATTLHIYSHAGTHIDAPNHFIDGDKGIDNLAPESFFADCHVVDLRNISPSSLINVKSLGITAEKISPGEGIIFRTGWSSHIGNDEMYRNALPRISMELARWIVSRKIKLIGVEPPSIADINNIAEVGDVHRLLLGAGIIIVEGLVNLHLIAGEKVKFIALPLKIKDCDGSPCRAIALE